MLTRTLRLTWRIALVLLALGAGLTFAGGLHLATHAAAPHLPVAMARSSRAPNLPSQLGDVFAGVGHGFIDHFDATGALIEMLDTASLSPNDTGMCIDNTGTLYTTNWDAGNMSTFDNLGSRQTFPWGGPFSIHPETCVVDASGNIYVGEVDGLNRIRKFSPTGALLGTWAPAAAARGVDWLDLAADQSTAYYTSEGSTVKRYDLSTSTQLPDFASGLPAPCYALRIRGNGEVMVACQTQLVRLDSTGTIIQRYPTSSYLGTSFLFAANLDPDGTSIWTGDYHTGVIYKIDIATGAALMHFTAPPQGASMAGLAIYGELTQALPTVTPGTPPPSATPQPPQATATTAPPPTDTPPLASPTETLVPEPPATPSPTIPPTTPPTVTPTPTDVPKPTRTPNPTNTPRPSATPPQTPPPAATSTPRPATSATSTPTPRPQSGKVTATSTPGGLGMTGAGQAPGTPPFADVRPSDPFYAATLALRDQNVVAGYPDGSFRPYALTTRGQVAQMVALAFGYTPRAGQAPAPAFTDVPAGYPFYSSIAALHDQQIVAGHADGTFRPAAPVTRGELAKLIVQARHWTLVTPPAPSFTDVPGNSPFFAYIETAYAHRVLSGYGDTFRPEAPATRGQVAQIVAGALAAPLPPVQP